MARYVRLFSTGQGVHSSAWRHPHRGRPGGPARDTDLIKSLITATFISPLIFQRKYLLPSGPALKVRAFAFRRLARKGCSSQPAARAPTSTGSQTTARTEGTAGGLLPPQRTRSAEAPPSCGAEGALGPGAHLPKPCAASCSPGWPTGGARCPAAPRPQPAVRFARPAPIRSQCFGGKKHSSEGKIFPSFTFSLGSRKRVKVLENVNEKVEWRQSNSCPLH